MTRTNTVLLIMAGLALAAPVGVLCSDSGAVVTRVGSREISRAKLDDAVQQALNNGYFHRRMTDERRAELEREQIGNLIRRELNYLGALEQKVVLSEGQAEQARAAIEERLGRENYDGVLKAAGMTREDHRSALNETLLAAEAYRRFVLEPAAVGDDEIRTAFEAGRDHWVMPESLHLLHILLKVPPAADDGKIGEIKGRAEALAARIRAGEDFSDIAAVSSEDMYSIKGGDLGWVHRGRLLPAIDEAAWGAEMGRLVGPILSPEGFHIIKVLERRPARPMDFAEVEPMLRERLEKEKLDKAQSVWFDALREKFPVVILDPGLDQGVE